MLEVVFRTMLNAICTLEGVAWVDVGISSTDPTLRLVVATNHLDELAESILPSPTEIACTPDHFSISDIFIVRIGVPLSPNHEERALVDAPPTAMDCRSASSPFR